MAGRLVSTASPDTGTTTYSYDSRGNPVTKTDAVGIAVSYGYDDLSRLTAINYPAYGSFGAWTASYAYDLRANGKGRLSNIITPNGPLYFDYDERGRLKQKKTKLNSLDYILTRTFTPAGRVTSLTYPVSGRQVIFTRSTACECHVEKVKTKLGELETVLLENIAYRPFGGPSEVSSANGGNARNGYDLDGRIVGAGIGKAKARNYSYYSSGRLKAAESLGPPWVSASYEYNGPGMLTTVRKGPLVDFSVTYDGVGNRIQTVANGGVETSYTYSPNGNRLAEVIQGLNTAAYTYDARGNPTSITANAGTKNFVFNQANQLIRVHEGGSNLGLYRYNGLNQRIRKEAGGVVTYYVYDFDGNLIQEAAPDGTIRKEYFYWGDTRLAMAKPNGSIYYFHNDHLGTPEMMTDSTKTVVWEAVHLPFGEAVVNSNSSVVNNFRLPGQYFDAETGLHYNWHRYYDPKTGRYLTPDPIGLAGGINLYVYAGGDPVNWDDPLGLSEYDLGAGWRARVDQFNTAGGASYEIHVFDKSGNEAGIYGPKGWINKHGIQGGPGNIPKGVYNKLNGINVDLLRRQGLIPPKGQCDIKGGKYMKGLGVFGGVLTIIDIIDTANRAQKNNKTFDEQYFEDMYGPAFNPAINPYQT